MSGPVTLSGLKGALMSRVSAWAVVLHGVDGVLVEIDPACPVRKPFECIFSMIIVSESSAKATQLVRTDRYTSPRHRSSAPRDDALSYVDARPISVHTEEVTGSIPVSPTQLRILINDLVATNSPQYSNEVQQ
jgi:hypothetical protein